MESLAGDLSGSGLTGRAAGRAAAASRRHVNQGAEPRSRHLGAGLGESWPALRAFPVRLTLEDLQQRWPNLIPGLCAHEGIGFIAGLDTGRSAVGHRCRRPHRLDTGEVTGEDPLRPYGDHAARVLRRAVVMPEAPDLYLNSRVDDVTLDVAAFEPLVGAHGGLGGWQDRAILLVPRVLAHVLPDEHIEGADRVHSVLVEMLRAVGQRKTVPERPDQRSGRDPDLPTDS